MRLKSCRKFALVLVFWALFFPLKWLLAAGVAVFLHEMSHLAVCKILGIKIFGIRALPWGLTLSAPIIYKPQNQLAVSIAGPMCNFFLLLLCPIIKIIFGDDIANIFAIANIADGVFNLIPSLPLDGGIILKSYLCSRFGFLRGLSYMFRVTAVFGFLFMLLGIHILVLTGKNASYLMAGGFILWNLKHERELNMCIKKRILTGEIQSMPPAKTICADAKSNAICLVNKISPSYTLEVKVTKNGKLLGTISQKALLSRILENSIITLEECIEKNENPC